jgi:hypothetical protein
MIDDKSKKYLKNIIRLSENVPLNPLNKINIPDNATITTNKILLKKFSDISNCPNFPVTYLMFNDSLVCFPVYIIINKAFPEAILTPLHAVFYKFNPIG